MEAEQKGTIITCDFTPQKGGVCVCVWLIHHLGQVSQDRVKLLSLMASAFFICQPFNYSQWKNMETLPLTHTHTFSSSPPFSLSLTIPLACLCFFALTPHPMSLDLKASQSVTYLLTQVRGHM